MSTLKVEVVQVERVEPHPNADKLDIAHIKGWQCVVGKGEFNEGDQGFYFPIDSVLPEPLLNQLFQNSKIKPPSRIKTIKLRGAISQGLLVREALKADGQRGYAQNWPLGFDMTNVFGVTKYEPPQDKMPNLLKAGQQRTYHPDFERFTDLENIKNYPDVFKEGDLVIVTEKVHGTNFRCGWVPFHANTLWKRFKKLIGLAPSHEFVYGSRNMQLKESSETYFASNVYAEIVEKYDLRNQLLYGEVLYGEIYGDGIQKGFTYGCDLGQHKLAAFDLMRDGEWVNAFEMCVKFERRGIPMVPCHYAGPYKKDLVKGLVTGESSLGNQPVKEGVVVRSIAGHERDALLGRKILKVINDDYLLLNDNSDWH